MLSLGNISKRLALTLLLTALALFWPNIAESAPREIEYTGDGYYLSEQAGRDILEGWLSDRAAKKQYKTALDSMYDEWQRTKQFLDEQISEIRKSHLREQEDWKRALRKSRAPGFGVFAGPGYTGGHDVQLVVGFGLVWKLF